MARNNEGQSKYPAARSITMVGNMCDDPREIITQGDADNGAGFRIGVNSRDHKGQELTEFPDVTIWGYWAKAVMENMKKGQRVSVVGDLYFDEYEGKRKLRIEASLVTQFVYPSDGKGGGSSRGRDDSGDERRSSRGDSSDGGSRRSSRDSEDEPRRERGERSSRSSEDEPRRSSRDDSPEDEPRRERGERSSRSSEDEPRRERSSARSSSSRDRGDSLGD